MSKGDWARELELDPFTTGFVLGLLVGEGHFGGDGQQAQVTVRMHVRHQQLLRWLARTFPGSKTYGPYLHNGRHYMQWMARGPVLYDVIVLLVGRHLQSIDDHVAFRFKQMCARYGLGGIRTSHGASWRCANWPPTMAAALSQRVLTRI